MSHTPRRTIVYTRQSTYREESISLELQESAGNEHAKRHGDTVVATVADPGYSGLKFARRPGIRKVIEAVESGQADVIVVWRWSRLSRRRIDQAQILDRIERAGGVVESATEPVDVTTAGGRLSRGVFMEFAAFDSEVKSEQWKEAHAKRVNLGMTPGGPAPYGYVRGAKGEPHRIHPVHGEVVRRMYADFLSGKGPQSICRWLNADGYTTPPRKMDGDDTAVGRAFTVVTVTRILDSGFAAGFQNLHDPECPCKADPETGKRNCSRRIRIVGSHEPIIDADTWDKYQRARDARRRLHPKARQPRWYLGGGLSVCGRCGANLVVNSYSPKSQVICSSYNMTRTCTGVWIDRVKLETAVALWLGGRVSEWADRSDELTGADDERARLAKALDAEREAETRLDAGRTAAARLLARGDMTEADYLAARAEAETERSAVAQRISDLAAQLEALDPSGDVYDRIERGAAGMSASEWNTLLRRVIRTIAVGPDVVILTPWLGTPAVWDRSVVWPRRVPPAGTTVRNASGRFTRRPTG